MKSRDHDENGGHERWLVSYADLLTLLFAFFVVMFASSQRDKQKAAAAEEAVRRAFNGDHAKARLAAVLGGTVGDLGQGNRMMHGPGGAKIEVRLPRMDAVDLLPSLEFLNRELAEDIAAGRLTIHMETRGLVVGLREAAYFVSGDDGISAAAYTVLQKIASTIEKMPNPIRLEGHTDSIPIHNSRFRSNWELSAARGISMLAALNSRFHVPENRMAVAGYADSFPVDTNETPEGRARNRRVDLVILSQSGLVSLPNSNPAVR